jgi:F-type H+-transporting ATPase subunit a
MEVQSTVWYILVITGVIVLLLLFVNAKLKKFDPLSKPKGVVLLAMVFVQFIDGMLMSETRNKQVTDKLGPYFGSVAIYIFLSNISGLFALQPPTSNFSVTIALAAITCIMIEVAGNKAMGPKAYFKSLCEPIAPFLLLNVIDKLSTWASLSLRLFGNILSGSLIMEIIYQMMALVSSKIPLIGGFNIVGVIIAPALHFYFDLFAGAMQVYIFITLSITFIGNAIPKEELKEN